MMAITPAPAFVCPLCGFRSWHPRDGAERFCASCGFVDDVLEAVLPMDEEHRALIVRGNLTGPELMELIKLVRSMHDRRPHEAKFEVLVVDESATIKDSEALLKDTLPGYAFRVYPFPR
jgi:hypothetical protein